MGFFPPRWVPAADPVPNARGWGAYVLGGIELPEVAPHRVATDVVLEDSGRARVWVPTIEAYGSVMTLEVRCDLREVRGGDALQALLDAGRVEIDGASPPTSGLLVGMELADGTRIRSYPVGPDDGVVRLQPRSGGSSAERDRPSAIYQRYGARWVPDRPFRLICSLTGAGIVEAEAVIDPLPRG